MKIHQIRLYQAAVGLTRLAQKASENSDEENKEFSELLKNLRKFKNSEVEPRTRDVIKNRTLDAISASLSKIMDKHIYEVWEPVIVLIRNPRKKVDLAITSEYVKANQPEGFFLILRVLLAEARKR